MPSYLKRNPACYATRHLERISGSLYVTSRFIPQDVRVYICIHTYIYMSYCGSRCRRRVRSEGVPIVFMSRLLLGATTRRLLPVPSPSLTTVTVKLFPNIIHDKWYLTFSLMWNRFHFLERKSFLVFFKWHIMIFIFFNCFIHTGKILITYLREQLFKSNSINTRVFLNSE